MLGFVHALKLLGTNTNAEAGLSSAAWMTVPSLSRESPTIRRSASGTGSEERLRHSMRIMVVNVLFGDLWSCQSQVRAAAGAGCRIDDDETHLSGLSTLSMTRRIGKSGDASNSTGRQRFGTV